MSLLSRMFGRKGPRKPIEEMSLLEIAEFVRGAETEVYVSDLISVARRLTDIALFEHGIPEEHREIALGLLQGVDADIAAGLKHDPAALAAYQQAAIHHRAGARQGGHGSLHWLMDEHGISGADVIPFIAREEVADLLPDYLEMMEPEVIHQVRGALLDELARARALDAETPLEVLHRLATSGDGSLTLLLDGRQLGAIGRAHVDPDTAEAVLFDLGVGAGAGNTPGD